MRLRIETKIVSGFLMLALLVGTIGYFNFNNIRRIDAAFSTMDEYHMPAFDSLNAMKTDALNIFSSTLKLEFAESEMNQSAQMREKSIKELTLIAEGKSRFGSALEKYRYMTDKYAAQNEKNIASAIEKKWAAFSAASDTFAGLKRRNAEKKEILDAKADLEDTKNSLLDTLDDAASYEEAIISESRDASGELVKNTLISTVLVLTITIIAALGSGLLISASITDPVKQLKDAADAVSRGNLDTKIKIDSGDEMEELADAFNKMVQDIRYSRELSEDRQKDLEDVRKQLEKDLKDVRKSGKLTERELWVINLKKKIRELEEELAKYEK